MMGSIGGPSATASGRNVAIPATYAIVTVTVTTAMALIIRLQTAALNGPWILKCEVVPRSA